MHIDCLSEDHFVTSYHLFMTSVAWWFGFISTNYIVVYFGAKSIEIVLIKQ